MSEMPEFYTKPTFVHARGAPSVCLMGGEHLRLCSEIEEAALRTVRLVRRANAELRRQFDYTLLPRFEERGNVRIDRGPVQEAIEKHQAEQQQLVPDLHEVLKHALIAAEGVLDFGLIIFIDDLTQRLPAEDEWPEECAG